jgi:hypothetical protein
MDRVAEGIWIAGYREASDATAQQWPGIDAVLQLYGPAPDPPPLPSGPEVRSLRVLDGAPIPPAALTDGVGFLRTQREQGRTVLVTCGLGQSRSPAFVAAYLHEQGMELGDAFAALMRCRPQVLPHPVLLRSLVEQYGGATTAEALLVGLVKLRRVLRSIARAEGPAEREGGTR